MKCVGESSLTALLGFLLAFVVTFVALTLAHAEPIMVVDALRPVRVGYPQVGAHVAAHVEDDATGAIVPLYGLAVEAGAGGEVCSAPTFGTTTPYASQTCAGPLSAVQGNTVVVYANRTPGAPGWIASVDLVVSPYFYAPQAPYTPCRLHGQCRSGRCRRGRCR